MPDQQNADRYQREQGVVEGDAAADEADDTGDHGHGDDLRQDLGERQVEDLGQHQRAHAVDQLIEVFPDDHREIVPAHIDEFITQVVGVVHQREVGGSGLVERAPQGPSGDRGQQGRKKKPGAAPLARPQKQRGNGNQQRDAGGARKVGGGGHDSREEDRRVARAAGE